MDFADDLLLFHIVEDDGELLDAASLLHAFESDLQHQEVIKMGEDVVQTTEALLLSYENATSTCTPQQGYMFLARLGSTLFTKAHGYIDASKINAYTPGSESSWDDVFPTKLYDMLMMLSEEDPYTAVAGFCPHGRAFVVRDKDRFVNEVLPRYFTQKNWRSFTRYVSSAMEPRTSSRLTATNSLPYVCYVYRQLNLYSFLRVKTGKDHNAYYHPLFLAGRPDLCRHMMRVGTPKGNDRRTHKYRQIFAKSEDPDFYQMEPITPAKALQL